MAGSAGPSAAAVTAGKRDGMVRIYRTSPPGGTYLLSQGFFRIQTQSTPGRGWERHAPATQWRTSWTGREAAATETSGSVGGRCAANGQGSGTGKTQCSCQLLLPKRLLQNFKRLKTTDGAYGACSGHGTVGSSQYPPQAAPSGFRVPAREETRPHLGRNQAEPRSTQAGTNGRCATTQAEKRAAYPSPTTCAASRAAESPAKAAPARQGATYQRRRGPRRPGRLNPAGGGNLFLRPLLSPRRPSGSRAEGRAVGLRGFPRS